MDDDDGNRGMSFTTGYVFGRMAAQSSQRTAEFKELVRQRSQPPHEAPYDADDVKSAIATWKAAVARRDAAIAQLQTELRESTARSTALQERLAAAGAEIRTLREKNAKHEHDIELLQNTITGVMDMHDAELTDLKAEIARLKGES